MSQPPYGSPYGPSHQQHDPGLGAPVDPYQSPPRQSYDQAYPGADDKKAHEAVEALYKGLAFPDSRSSPGKHASAEYLKGALKDLDALLKGP